MNNRKLKNLIKLSCSVKIYVPSTIDVDIEIDNKDKVDETLSFLSKRFGGATVYDAYGSWVANNGSLIKENIKIVESHCDSNTLYKNIDTVIEYCEMLKTKMKQEAISLEINNVLYFV